MTTNLQLVERILSVGSRSELEEAAVNLAMRLDIIASMKLDSPVSQAQLITRVEFFSPR